MQLMYVIWRRLQIVWHILQSHVILEKYVLAMNVPVPFYLFPRIDKSHIKKIVNQYENFMFWTTMFAALVIPRQVVPNWDSSRINRRKARRINQPALKQNIPWRQHPSKCTIINERFNKINRMRHVCETSSHSSMYVHNAYLETIMETNYTILLTRLDLAWIQSKASSTWSAGDWQPF